MDGWEESVIRRLDWGEEGLFFFPLLLLLLSQSCVAHLFLVEVVVSVEPRRPQCVLVLDVSCSDWKVGSCV